jgi:hypothetical protein
MRILIDTIPHRDQRYPTAGDWQFERGLHKDEDQLVIHISDLGHYNMNFLLGVHELVEAVLCKHRDVSEAEVDRFDQDPEREREGIEPGDNMAAPYFAEHQFASGIERLLAAELGVNWVEYERRVDALVGRQI